MRTFRCICGNRLFFENTRCTACGQSLGYDPASGQLLIQDASDWKTAEQTSAGPFRLCENYTEHNVCNWLVGSDDPSPLCRSCRLNDTIPDLSIPGNTAKWARIETAKRWLLYSVFQLGLSAPSKQEDPHGLTFQFLAETPTSSVETGHAEGIITLNIAEADRVERTQTQVELGERYRTLLGHLRHESGHYYWDRLVQNTALLKPYRKQFGDERKDYAAALEQHYEQGPAADWNVDFISPYASSHPWEDWAETWAHYLHMWDALDTASDYGISLAGHRKPVARPAPGTPIQQMIDNWIELSMVLNAFSRSLGQDDLYPFAFTHSVTDKLAFVSRTIHHSP